MTLPPDTKAQFSRFLDADPSRLHFAAHSHHLWPDVTFEAQERCWHDAAHLADHKWEAEIFGRLYPSVQARVARLLGLSDPGSLAFGPNTHGFLVRLLSHFPTDRPLEVLTSDGEFHSFTRQMRRLEEAGLARVTRVPVEPFASFGKRFVEAAERVDASLVYVSQVFYDSGFAFADLERIVAASWRPERLVVIDGYHGFMALPTDLGAIQDRAFYLSGGYKYAMAGEGVCFLHAPPGQAPRPRDTGWFAAFESLESSADGKVPYPASGARFLGATFDPVGLYRLEAVLAWLDKAGITVAEVHAHAHRLQARFVAGLAKLGLDELEPSQLVVPIEEPSRGNFLTFRSERAAELYGRLGEQGVVTDYRGDRLRFGFGLYQDEADVDRLCEVLRRCFS